MATLHVSDFTTHQVFTIEFKGVGYLRLAVSVVAITKIPVDAKRVPVGVQRAGRKGHLVLLINGGLGSSQFHLRRPIVEKRTNVHDDINPWHFLLRLTLGNRRHVQADALLNKRPAYHQGRIHIQTRTARGSIQQL